MHTAHQPDLPLFKHLAQDRAAVANLLHHQPHIRLGDLSDKLRIL